MPASDNPERFVRGSVLHARPPRAGIAGPRLPEQVRLTVETVRGDGDFPIVGFQEVADRDTAEALRGYVLEVRSSQLPMLAEDEFYPFDLDGLQVRDMQGAVVGMVADVVESPAHAILVVSLEAGGETMIPFVRAAVPTVAVADGFLVVEPLFLGGSEAVEGGGTAGGGDQDDAVSS